MALLFRAISDGQLMIGRLHTSLSFSSLRWAPWDSLQAVHSCAHVCAARWWIDAVMLVGEQKVALWRCLFAASLY